MRDLHVQSLWQATLYASTLMCPSVPDQLQSCETRRLEQENMRAHWQVFELPAQAAFQVSGWTSCWQSESVAAQQVTDTREGLGTGNTYHPT